MGCFACCAAPHMQPCEKHMLSCNRPVQRAVMGMAIIAGIIQCVVIGLIFIWIHNTAWLVATAVVLGICVLSCILILIGLFLNIPNLLLAHTVAQALNGLYALTAIGINIAAVVIPDKFHGFYDTEEDGEVRKKAIIFLAFSAFFFLALHDVLMVLKCRRHLIDCRVDYERLKNGGSSGATTVSWESRSNPEVVVLPEPRW